MQQHSVQLDTITPQRGPQHRELASFAGRWKMAGENSPTAPGQASLKVTGIETYEWLPGEYFLVNKWTRKMGASEDVFSGIGWIGFDPKLEGYVAHSASNLGFQRVYEVEVAKDQLIFNGESERATIVLNDDHTEIIVRWERREDGGSWKPLCHLEGIRLNS
ncbi:hypothetical protein BH10BDE1_BH10BDE1_16160 [soil metagenome]